MSFFLFINLCGAFFSLSSFGDVPSTIPSLLHHGMIQNGGTWSLLVNSRYDILASWIVWEAPFNFLPVAFVLVLCRRVYDVQSLPDRAHMQLCTNHLRYISVTIYWPYAGGVTRSHLSSMLSMLQLLDLLVLDSCHSYSNTSIPLACLCSCIIVWCHMYHQEVTFHLCWEHNPIENISY